MSHLRRQFPLGGDVVDDSRQPMPLERVIGLAEAVAVRLGRVFADLV